MATINQLSAVDSLQGGDQIPVYDQSNGDARKASLTTLTSFIESQIGDNFLFTSQIVSPATNGFVVIVNQTEKPTWLIMNPTQAWSSGSIILPAIAVAADDQEILVTCTQEVINFTIDGNGAAVEGAPDYLPPYSSFSLRYSQSLNTWYLMDNAGGADGTTSLSRDQFTGDGVTTVFTLSAEPAALGEAMEVFIDGIYQERSAYTVSGTTLTFSAAPPFGAAIETVSFVVSPFGSTTANLVSYSEGSPSAITRTVESRLRDFVTVEDFGAVGDGVTDDTAAIQAAFDESKVVHLTEGKTYLVDNLIIPNTSNWTLVGNNATLKKSASGDSYYLMASYKHINNIAEAQAPIKIFTVNFNADGNADHALILQNWNTDILDCLMTGAVYNGCMFTAETRAGATFPSSSLVNTRFKIISRNNGGCGLFVQDSARNNATDGTILQGSQFYGNGDYGVFIEPGAGWDIQCRTYGNGGGIGFNGHGQGTLVHDCYIDDGDGTVGALPVTGSTYSAAVYANAALGVTNFGVLPVTGCHISGPVTHAGLGDSPPYGIWSENNTYRTGGFIYHQYFSASRKIFSMNDRFIEANPFRFHNGSSTGIIEYSNAYLEDKKWFISGSMDATTDTNYQTVKYDRKYDRLLNFTVNPTPFSVNFDVPPTGNYTGQIAKVYIYTRDNYNAAPRCAYEGTIYVQAKINGSDAWVGLLTNTLFDPADFTVAPAIVTSDNGDGTGDVTLSFDTAAASGYGRCIIKWV